MAKALHSLMRKAALAVLLLLGIAAPSMAATLYISEYANIGSIGSNTTPWPPGPVLASQTVALSGSSAASSAFNSQTKAVLLTCDEGCSISFGTSGSSPTATTSTTLLQQGVPYVFVTSGGQKIAAIANAAGNTPGGGAGTPTDVTIVGPLGQATSAASVPVVIASDQGAIPVSQASQPLPTGAATSANQTNASQKTQIVDGSGSVAGSQSFAGSANFLNVTTPDELPFSGTASSAIVIPVSINGGATQNFIDTSGYESISVQITSAGVATTLTYEGSDDNANWLATAGANIISIGTLTPSTTSSGVSIFYFPKHARYFRVRVSTYGSGTVTIVGNLHKNPQPLTNRVTADGPVTTNGVSVASGFSSYAVGRTANATAVSTGTSVQQIATILGVGITKPYSIPEADWQTAVSLSTTGSTALQAAGGAGVKNYLTAIQFSGNAALVANTIQILSGASVIWGPHTIAAATAFTQITFPTPLQTGAATALNVQIGTTPVGALEVTAQGYAAAD